MFPRENYYQHLGCYSSLSRYFTSSEKFGTTFCGIEVVHWCIYIYHVRGVIILLMNMFGVQGYMVFYVCNDDFVNPLDFVDGLIGSVGLVTFVIRLHRDACCPCVKWTIEPRRPEQVRCSSDTSEKRFQETHDCAAENVKWTKAEYGTVTIYAPQTSEAGCSDVESVCCKGAVTLQRMIERMSSV